MIIQRKRRIRASIYIGVSATILLLIVAAMVLAERGVKPRPSPTSSPSSTAELATVTKATPTSTIGTASPAVPAVSTPAKPHPARQAEATPTAEPTPSEARQCAPVSQPPDGSLVITLDQNHLGVDGKVWRYKGAQLSLPSYPWEGVVTARQTSEYRQELDWALRVLAREQAGLNAIRVFFQYGYVTEDDGALLQDEDGCSALRHLDYVLDRAWAHGLRTSVVLFNPDQATFSGTRNQTRFLETVASHYQNDPRIAFWEIVNEINDGDWMPEGVDRRLDWAHTMGLLLRDPGIDGTHLVTISVQATGEGSVKPRILDYWRNVSWDTSGTLATLVDFYSPHLYTYSKSDMSDAVHLARKKETKPVLLGEVGWPTGPVTDAAPNSRWTEWAQKAVIDNAIAVANEYDLVGLNVWMLVDYDGAPDDENLSQSYYGLFWSPYTASHSPGSDNARPFKPKAAVEVIRKAFVQ